MLTRCSPCSRFPFPPLSSTELPILNSLTSQQPVHSSSSAAAAAASAAAVAAKIHAASSSSSSSSAGSTSSPKRSPQSSPRSGDDPSQADTPRGAPESELGVLAASASGPGSAPSKGHWNATITDLTSDVSATLARLDGALWASVQKQLAAEFGSVIRLASANSQYVREQLVKTKTHMREAKMAVINSAVY